MSDLSSRNLDDLPLDYVEVIHALGRASDDSGCPFMIVGALARDIWLHYCHGIPATRKTDDIDFAVKVGGWVQYDEIRRVLIDDEGFRMDEAPDHPERLTSPGGAKLDLLPFGGIGDWGDWREGSGWQNHYSLAS